MVAPSKFAHVVYSTHRYEEMIDWYTKVFETETVHGGDRLTFLTYDDEHHRFAFLNLGEVDEESAPRSGEVGVHHVAYTWDDLDGLMDTYERLRDLGVTPAIPIRHGLTLSMYYEDPDGNRSEFQIDLMGEDAAKAFMGSSAFEANPVGEPFDPDELLAAYRAGDDVASLVWRSDQEAVPFEKAPS